MIVRLFKQVIRRAPPGDQPVDKLVEAIRSIAADPVTHFLPERFELGT